MSTPARRIVALAGCGLILIAGCGDDPSRPPTIRYGEEACARCRMIISDDRFAAALVTRNGETSKFDDIGCLIESEASRPAPTGTAYWVRDFAEGQWLDARAATYIRSAAVASPMGYGLKAQARGEPSAPGTTWKFTELPVVVAAQRGEQARPVSLER